MKLALKIVLFCLPLAFSAQKKVSTPPASMKKAPHQTVSVSANADLAKIREDVAALIPQKKDGKFGYINQSGKVVIPHEYSNVGFFAEDCNLLSSPNGKAKKFGTAEYASVRLNGKDYRINKAGKRVYIFKDSDLGKCPREYKSQLFHAYIMNDHFGIIEDEKFENPGDYRQFTIYPQYDYLHIMEGTDLSNPMIVAAKNNRFGVIDINNKIVIPFEYSDIKRNYSWILGGLFEVTKDGRNYYYIDSSNKGY